MQIINAEAKTIVTSLLHMLKPMADTDEFYRYGGVRITLDNECIKFYAASHQRAFMLSYSVTPLLASLEAKSFTVSLYDLQFLLKSLGTIGRPTTIMVNTYEDGEIEFRLGNTVIKPQVAKSSTLPAAILDLWPERKDRWTATLTQMQIKRALAAIKGYKQKGMRLYLDDNGGVKFETQIDYVFVPTDLEDLSRFELERIAATTTNKLEKNVAANVLRYHNLMERADTEGKLSHTITARYSDTSIHDAPRVALVKSQLDEAIKIFPNNCDIQISGGRTSTLFTMESEGVRVLIMPYIVRWD